MLTSCEQATDQGTAEPELLIVRCPTRKTPVSSSPVLSDSSGAGGGGDEGDGTALGGNDGGPSAGTVTVAAGDAFAASGPGLTTRGGGVTGVAR